jgi:hypothetical protein
MLVARLAMFWTSLIMRLLQSLVVVSSGPPRTAEVRAMSRLRTCIYGNMRYTSFLKAGSNSTARTSCPRLPAHLACIEVCASHEREPR